MGCGGGDAQKGVGDFHLKKIWKHAASTIGSFVILTQMILQ